MLSAVFDVCCAGRSWFAEKVLMGILRCTGEDDAWMRDCRRESRARQRGQVMVLMARLIW